MIKISSDFIKQAVYELCFKANVCINDCVYTKILNACENEKDISQKNNLKLILKNAKTAFEKIMPLCQDTGQVIVFLEVGQNVLIEGDFINSIINSAVENCYRDNFFRKSTVKNAVFDRTNTFTNTPCVIHSKYIKEDEVRISVLIKGAGSENKTKLKMLLPTLNCEEIVQTCVELIRETGISACPPMFIGIGIGSDCEEALLSSKEALISEDFTKDELELAQKIKEQVNNSVYNNSYVLDVKLKTMQTHIACMPVGVTINCHSERYSKAVIKGGKIFYDHKIPKFKEFEIEDTQLKEINTSDIDKLKNLKRGENILLTGEIYTARDAAHKKLIDLIRGNKKLPFELNNKIIFYTGPCPAKPNEIIGSTGPTTSSRMDKYAKELYERGIFATIGKGERDSELINYISESGKKYFTVQGGIAAYLAQKIKKSELIAFEELGAEAIYKLKIEKFPVKSGN